MPSFLLCWLVPKLTTGWGRILLRSVLMYLCFFLVVLLFLFLCAICAFWPFGPCSSIILIALSDTCLHIHVDTWKKPKGQIILYEVDHDWILSSWWLRVVSWWLRVVKKWLVVFRVRVLNYRPVHRDQYVWIKPRLGALILPKSLSMPWLVSVFNARYI